MNRRTIKPSLRLSFSLFCFLWFSMASVAPLRASLFDDETRLGRELQSQIQMGLDQVFGKRKSQALVEVRLDLSPTLKARFDKALEDNKPAAAAAPAPPPDDSLPWPSVTKDQEGLSLSLFQKKKRLSAPEGAVAVPAPASPFLNPDFLLSAGLEIKRVGVRVLLDRSLPEASERSAQQVVEGVVSLNPERGDVLSVIRVGMPTLKDEILRDPAAITALFGKATTAAVLLVLGLLLGFLIAMGLVVFRGSVHRMAKALETLGLAATSHRVSVAKEENPAASLPGADNTEGLEALSGPAEGTPAGDSKKMLFNVQPDQVVYLHHLLQNEPVENVALVVPHLPEKVRTAFLALQASDRAAALLSQMAQVTLVEPELILRLKEELEKRLAGSVGGIDAVMKIMESATGPEREKLLGALREKNAALAAEVRGRTVLFDDLSRFSDADLALLISQVKMETLATALTGITNGLSARVRSTLTDFQRRTLQELFETRTPPASKVSEARDQMVLIAQKLLREGRAQLAALKEEHRLLA